MTSRQEYLKRLQLVNSYEDMADFMNEIKNIPYQFRAKAIQFYTEKNKPYGYFMEWQIHKKHGGTRDIIMPSKPLDHILKTLLPIFEAIYAAPSCVCGFVKGKSLVDNARPHVGRRFVLSMDLKDFFPSISRTRLEDLFLNRLKLNEYVSMVFSGLCTVNKEGNQAFMPQGFCTSPVLSNMICEDMDHDLQELADRHGLNYTRYADDITFSADEDVLRENASIALEIKEVIAKNGFTLNDKKTHLQRYGRRQHVTGVVVNKKLSLSREYIREIRNILFIWERYGYEDASERAYPHYLQRNGKTRGHGYIHLDRVLGGRLAYLKMVRGEDDPVYRKLMDKYVQLLADTKSKLKKVNNMDRYHRTMDERYQWINQEFPGVNSYPFQHFLEDTRAGRVLRISLKIIFYAVLVFLFKYILAVFS